MVADSNYTKSLMADCKQQLGIGAHEEQHMLKGLDQLPSFTKNPVKAIKIKSITFLGGNDVELTPEDSTYASIRVQSEFFDELGGGINGPGYYVAIDGTSHACWWPVEHFESTYTPVPE